MRCSKSGEGGFTLVEVLISAGLLAGAAASAAYLVARAVENAESTRLRTVGTVAAVQKMEQLRSLAWSHETDTTTTIDHELPMPGGTGLLPSPPGTLDASVAPYVDYLDADGALQPPGASAAADLARRWSVQAHPLDPDLLVLQVVVTRARGPASRTAARPGPYDVELLSLRARHQP